jgi:hypothetical protein
MTTSSVLTDCSTILNDTITTLSTGSCDTITLNSGGYTIASGSISSPVYTFSSGMSHTISINNVEPVFSWGQEEFVNCLPDIDRINAMCKEYPGLKICLLYTSDAADEMD